MGRRIQDLNFKDNIYTEPQTLKELTILDDVRRTLGYGMVFDGRRWIQQRPDVGGEEYVSVDTPKVTIAPGDITTMFSSNEQQRGKIIRALFEADDKNAQIFIYLDNVAVGNTLEKVWSLTGAFEALYEMGDTDGLWKLSKYDTTSNEYVMYLMRSLDISHRFSAAIGNPTGGPINGRITCLYTQIDDRISGREK